MVLLRFSLAALLVAALPHAQQTTITAQAAGDLSSAALGSGVTSFQHVAPGTPIGSGSPTLDLDTSITTGTYLHAITLGYPTQPSQDGIGFNFFERAYARAGISESCGSSSSPTVARAQLGPHAVLLTLGNAPGRRGRIVFQFRSSVGSTGSVGGAIDIGNDGTVEFSTAATATREFPWVMGVTGTVDVLVSNDCRVVGTGTGSYESAWTEIWVGFRPDLTATCTITSYGTGCGPQAAASDAVIGTSRVVTFLTTGAFPHEPVIAITGAHAINLPLPGNCALLSSLDIATLGTADPAGLATHTMVIPATLTGTTFHQFVPVHLVGTDLVITTSNGLRVDCR